MCGTEVVLCLSAFGAPAVLKQSKDEQLTPGDVLSENALGLCRGNSTNRLSGWYLYNRISGDFEGTLSRHAEQARPRISVSAPFELRPLETEVSPLRRTDAFSAR